MVMVTKRDKLILWLLIGVSAYLVIDDIWRLAFAEGAILPKRIEAHNDIIAGGLAPYRYRVLVPHIVEAGIQSLSNRLDYATAFLLVYAVYFFAAIAALLISLYLYLKIWLTDNVALVGCLFAAITLTAGFRYFYPYSFLEVALFTIGLNLIYHRKDAWLIPLVIIASLTRETSIFIVIAYIVHNRKVSPVAIVLSLIWLAVFFGLRYWLGDTPRSVTVAEIWAENSSPRGLYEGAVNGLVFFGVLWFATIAHVRQSPPYLKSMVLVGLLYLATVLIFGRWEETRLLMLLYPIVLPLALRHLNPYN